MSIKKTLLGLTASTLFLTPLAAGAETYDIDPDHTFVVFKVKHLGIGQAYGMFRKTTGNFDPEAGKMNVVIDAGSVYTANKKRDEHLVGADFFNAKQFPKITFDAGSVTEKGDGEYAVKGKLTIKGKTKPATMMVKKVGEGEDPWGNYRQGFEGSITVNRMDFGVDYMPDGLSEEVELMFAVEGIKQGKKKKK